MKILTNVKTYATIYYIGGAMKMKNVNITTFRNNIYNLLENTIKYNEPINISTKNGNAVVLSENDYNSLIETLYIESVPGLKEKILKAAEEPFEECIPEDEVDL